MVDTCFALYPPCRHRTADQALLYNWLPCFTNSAAFLRREIAHVLGYLHRAEARAAHRAEVRDLAGFLGHGFVVKFARLVRVEAEAELVFPAEFEACLGQRVVAYLRAGMPLGEIGGVRGDLVGDDAFLHIVLVR